MSDATTSTRAHVFPANGCRCEAIEADDPFMRAAGVRPGRPEIGRRAGRPDAALSPWTLTPVPPVRVEETGERCYLALCKHGTPRALVVATSDAEAIATTRAIHPERLVLCDKPMTSAALETRAPVVTLGSGSMEAVATMALTTAIFRRKEDIEAADEPSRFTRACAKVASLRLWETELGTTLLEVEATDHADYRERWTVLLEGPASLLGITLVLAPIEVPLRLGNDGETILDLGGSIRMLVKFERASSTEMRQLLERGFGTDLIPLPVSMRHCPGSTVPNAEEWRVLTGVLEALVQMHLKRRASATVDVRGAQLTVRKHEAAVLLDGIAGGHA